MILETFFFLVIFALGAGCGGGVIYCMFQFGLLEVRKDDDNATGSGNLKSA